MRKEPRISETWTLADPQTRHDGAFVRNDGLGDPTKVGEVFLEVVGVLFELDAGPLAVALEQEWAAALADVILPGHGHVVRGISLGMTMFQRCPMTSSI